MIAALKNIFHRQPHEIKELQSAHAYDIWAGSYDSQPDNLMLHLDEDVFSGLLAGIDIKGKHVADIGCGTGRHWDKLLKCGPANLTGFDVSWGMLDRLQEKYPQADTYRITDNLFSYVPDEAYDLVISTLTVAHVENIAEALKAWGRILKEKSDIIITDFHPDALAAGGKRTFEHDNGHLSVQNFVHRVYEIEAILIDQGFTLVKTDERIVDEGVKHFYTTKKALHVYDKFKGSNIIYGIHLRRE